MSEPGPWSRAALVTALRTHLFGVEGGLIGRCWTLITRPGRAAGRALARDSDVFAEPIRIYLFANLVFFLIGPSVGLLAFTLDSLAAAPGYADFVTAQIGRLDLDTAVYRERFNSAFRFRQPAFVIVLALPLAAVSRLLVRREPAGRHLVASLLFLAWVLLAWPAIRIVGGTLVALAGLGNELWPNLAVLLAMLGTTIAAARAIWRRGFRHDTGGGWLAGVLMALALLGGLAAYGHVIFWLTFASMEWSL